MVNTLYCDNTILRHALYDDMFQRIKPLPSSLRSIGWHGWLRPVGTTNRHESELLTVRCQVRSSMLELAWLCPCWLAKIIQHSQRLSPGVQILGTVYQSYSLDLPWRPQTGARTHWPDDCWPADACRNIVLSHYSVLMDVINRLGP